MALLTPAGLARLAPESGRALIDGHVEVGALIGDAGATALRDAVVRDGEEASALDLWLRARLLGAKDDERATSFDAICATLAQADRVDEAADGLGLSRRHLSRLLGNHLGLGPKTLIDLHRLDRSLRAVQTRSSSGAEGFADQAHQVRSWRARLGTTPGRYLREGPSVLAGAFQPAWYASSFYL